MQPPSRDLQEKNPAQWENLTVCFSCSRIPERGTNCVFCAEVFATARNAPFWGSIHWAMSAMARYKWCMWGAACDSNERPMLGSCWGKSPSAPLLSGLLPKVPSCTLFCQYWAIWVLMHALEVSIWGAKYACFKSPQIVSWLLVLFYCILWCKFLRTSMVFWMSMHNVQT